MAGYVDPGTGSGYGGWPGTYQSTTGRTAASTGTRAVGGGATIVSPLAWEAAQQAYIAAYQQALLSSQDRWHAEEMAQRAADRELQKWMALGYIGGEPTLETMRALGYIRGQPTLERELGTGELGLRYLQLLASQTGPRDWISYWNTVRAAEQTNLPAWARSLTEGLKLPAFQAPVYRAPQVGASPWAAQGTGGGAAAAQQLPTVLPHQVNAQTWANMLPSERAGLQGMVEQQGGWWPDFEQQMLNAFPTGRARRRTVWGT